MKRIILSPFFFFLIVVAFGQNKEKAFYSFLQQKIQYELKDNDSLIIDQISEKTNGDNWQAIIKIKKDSCLVKLLPPQVSQDTMVLPNEIITPVNVFLTAKADLLSLFEQAKNESNVSGRYSPTPVEIFVTQYDKPNEPQHFKSKRFQLRWTQSLYCIFRYNKISK